jgi:hypothetical protein
MKSPLLRSATLGLGLVVGLAAVAVGEDEATKAPVASAEVAESASGSFPTGTFVTAEWRSPWSTAMAVDAGGG